MIQARRIGYAAFDTPDIEKAIDYYTRINGLALLGKERGQAFLATKGGMLAVELRENANARCAALSFEVAPDADFGALRRSLAAEGIKSEERTGPAPGVGKSLVFADPNGTGIELFPQWTYGGGHNVTGVGPLKLGHVAFFAPDPLLLSKFYQRFLGFRISDWIEDFFVFMRCNADHHTVNFLRGETPRMHHIAFELKDASEICASCDVLTKDKIGIVWGPLRLGPGHNIAAFHRDHDGQLVEFYAELDQMKDETLGYYDPRPWHRDAFQRPKVWTRDQDPIWGPPPPQNFL